MRRSLARDIGLIWQAPDSKNSPSGLSALRVSVVKFKNTRYTATLCLTLPRFRRGGEGKVYYVRMRVRQKELRRTRKRLEERKKLAAKGIAITGTGAVTAPAAQKISRPVSRRASETTPAPRPQNDRGPRRDGNRDGGRREYGNDRGPRRDGPRDERPRDDRPRETPAAEASAPVETTAPAEAPVQSNETAPATTEG